MLAMRIDEALEERLTAVAHRTGRKKTMIVREAIAAKIDHLEELAAAEAALHAAFAERGERLEQVKLALGSNAPGENQRMIDETTPSRSP